MTEHRDRPVKVVTGYQFNQGYFEYHPELENPYVHRRYQIVRKMPNGNYVVEDPMHDEPPTRTTE